MPGAHQMPPVRIKVVGQQLAGAGVGRPGAALLIPHKQGARQLRVPADCAALHGLGEGHLLEVGLVVGRVALRGAQQQATQALPAELERAGSPLCRLRHQRRHLVHAGRAWDEASRPDGKQAQLHAVQLQLNRLGALAAGREQEQQQQ
eukprot:GHRQ01036958.1.p2 GENE.GHRQ01036958.1~~GHRQ01036958.1.p2  ORF type:complete len:174 (-),score=100.26 GHRQ01036958.1:79-522(-)